MISLSSASVINRIEIFSWWTGFADPPSVVAKLTINNSGNHLLRRQWPEATSDELPVSVLSRLVSALARPAIPKLDSSIFGLPPSVIERHYDSSWTDDHPAHLIRIHCEMDRRITVKTDAQYAFMLPLQITDSAVSTPFTTFDPELSRALPELMPESYLDRGRLAGRLGMLEWDLRELDRSEGKIHAAEEPASFLDDLLSSPDEGEIESETGLSGQGAGQGPSAADRLDCLSELLLRRNSIGVAKRLLARGADPSAADEHGQTALMHAAFPPFHQERFDLLVSAGADLEARRHDGLSGLDLACVGGEEEVAAEWIRAGACIFARGPGGSTPLMLGATWPEMTRMLLDHGADVNAVDEDGHCALVYAILRGRALSADQEMVAIRALIDAGADVNLSDHDGVPPLGHAKNMLAAAILEEEVALAFYPNRKPRVDGRWDRLQQAEEIVRLLTAAGAHE